MLSRYRALPCGSARHRKRLVAQLVAQQEGIGPGLKRPSPAVDGNKRNR